MDALAVSLPRKQTGAANVVDMALTAPLFVATMLVIVQFALICHAAIVVQFAAYSAARTARVSLWEADLAFRDLQCTNELLCEAIKYTSLATTAARFAGDPGNFSNLADKLKEGRIELTDSSISATAMRRLMSISPADRRLQQGFSPGADTWNPSAIDQLATDLTEPFGNIEGIADRQTVIRSKARYAFDERNTVVTWTILPIDGVRDQLTGLSNGSPLEIARGVLGAGEELNDWLSIIPYFSHNAMRLPVLPVEVKVRYRFALQVPFAARIFNNDSQRPYGRFITFTVRLT